MDAVKLKKGLNIGCEIERVDGRELSYSEFANRYLAKNQPVVLTGLMDDWRACRDWVCEDGSPNLSFISARFGKSQVQVADCSTKELTDQKRVDMSVSEFIEQWIALSCENHDGMAINSDGKSLLYLKDWHLIKEYPEYVAYKTPLFFCDDWLNLYLDQYSMQSDLGTCQERNEITCSDYRFVYMGPKGTWTPLHADVFRSYRWSANVCGAKLWLFLPPSQKHLVFDRYMKNSVYNIFEDVDESKFPGFKKAVWLECNQGANEIIFVPSGWYHQVHNLEDTISINHNWFNGHNLGWVWELLLQDYNEAKEMIEDIRDICDDFESLCQRNLAANTGMNFRDFLIFLVRMSFTYIAELLHLAENCNTSLQVTDSFFRHIVFDLLSIRRIASSMESALSEPQGNISLNFSRLHNDPAFVELLNRLDRTYRGIHELFFCPSYGTKSAQTDGIKSLEIGKAVKDYVISSPDGLISLIDSALSDFEIVSEDDVFFFEFHKLRIKEETLC